MLLCLLFFFVVVYVCLSLVNTDHHSRYPDSSLMQCYNELLSWSCKTFSNKDPKSCSSTYGVKGDKNAQRLDLSLQPLAAYFATEARSVRWSRKRRDSREPMLILHADEKMTQEIYRGQFTQIRSNNTNTVCVGEYRHRCTNISSLCSYSFEWIGNKKRNLRRNLLFSWFQEEFSLYCSEIAPGDAAKKGQLKNYSQKVHEHKKLPLLII